MPDYEGQTDRWPVDVVVSRRPLPHPTTVYDKRWSPLATTKCLSTAVICRYLSHAPFHLITQCVYEIDVSVGGTTVAGPRTAFIILFEIVRTFYLRTAQTARSVQCGITG